MTSSFQGIRYHDLTHVNAWLEANLHKILKWSLFCNLYQNLSKTGNDRKKSVGLLFFHMRNYILVSRGLLWSSSGKKRKYTKKIERLNYGGHGEMPHSRIYIQ